MDLSVTFQEFIQDNNLFSKRNKLLLAVSGGIDSVVLCHLCKMSGYNFAIAHCNFHLRDQDSNRDAAFVKVLAEKYAVPFYLNEFDTKIIAAANKKSIEETARDLRYSWFQQLLKNENLDCVLTAHHADDNIETVIMNFFRGTGVKGLRGIEPKQNKIIRPLLFARRKEIEEYASFYQLEYVTDNSNFENLYTRNFFRNRIIPEIQTVFPEAGKNVLHNTERMTEVEQLYRQAINVHKKNLLEQKGSEVHIPVLKLKKSVPLQTILYEIIKDFGFKAAQTKDVIDLLDADNSKFISSSTHRIIKNRKWLIITPVVSTDIATIIIEEDEKEVSFEKGKLVIGTTPFLEAVNNNNAIASFDAALVQFPLLLRKWKTGDYFYPLGMKKKKKLARFFIDQKLSKTEKENVWVMESGKKIIWVIGHRIDDRFKVVPSTKDILRFTLQTKSL